MSKAVSVLEFNKLSEAHGREHSTIYRTYREMAHVTNGIELQLHEY